MPSCRAPGLSIDDLRIGPTAIESALRASCLAIESASELAIVACLVLAGLVNPPGRLQISAHL